MSRTSLIALVIAFCSGTAQAQYLAGSAPGQYQSGSAAGSASAASYSMSAPVLTNTTTSYGSGGLDLQNSSTQSGCDRSSGNIMKYGGLMSEDMKAAAEYCKWTQSIPMPQ